MQETKVTFETAKLAEEKGFKVDWKQQRDYYDRDTKKLGSRTNTKLIWDYYEKTTIAAPTQSLLQKWLREVHNIYVTASPEINRYNYPKVYISESRNPKLKMFYWSHYRKIRYEDGKIYVKDIDFMGWFNGYKKFKTYEEALEFGLQEALKLIK